MSPARRRPVEEQGGFVDFSQAPALPDPAVSALLNQGQRRQNEARLPAREREKKRKEKEKMHARKPGHTTYDIPVSLRRRIADLAERERLPASQLAGLALLRLVHDLESGALDLGAYKIASRSPRFDFILNLPLEYLDGGEKRGRKRLPG